MAGAGSGFDIDVAGATEAFNSAGGVEKLMNDERRESEGFGAPPEATQPATPSTSDAPAGVTDQTPPAQQPAPVQSDSGWGLNVDELPPEVQPLAKSLLGDYTRKTQEIAEQRRQFEQFGDPNAIREALELRETLQDPNSWPVFHAQLTQGLQEMGYTFDEAQAIADEAVSGEQPVAEPLPDLAAIDDPELAPLRAHLERAHSEVDELRQELHAMKAAEREEQLRSAVLGELTRQENAIRQARPDYTDEDVEAIYERASYFSGNLLQAQQAYEADAQRMLSRWLAQKSSPHAHAAAPVPGGGTVTEQDGPEIKTFDDAHAATMERLRQVGALDG